MMGASRVPAPWNVLSCRQKIGRGSHDWAWQPATVEGTQDRCSVYPARLRTGTWRRAVPAKIGAFQVISAMLEDPARKDLFVPDICRSQNFRESKTSPAV